MKQPTTKTQSQILLILSSHLGVDPESLTPEADLASDLNLHSLELADVAAVLEQAFKIVIPNEESAAWETVADILHDVTEKIAIDTPGQ